MRIVGHGHRSVRATHAKTFEFSPDTEISERASCVVAVRSQVEDPVVLAGPVRLTISAGEESCQVSARANPGWVPGGGAVIRRSAVRGPQTLATHADTSAAQLPRSLVAALRDPGTPVSLEITPVPGPPLVVLAMLDPAGPLDERMMAELAAADEVVVEDAAAARLLQAAPGTVRATPIGSRPQATGRVLVLACEQLPGRSVAGLLQDVAVETVGLPPALAAACASPARASVVIVGAGEDPRAALRSAAPGTRIVVATSADRVAALVESATRMREVTGTVIARTDRPPVRLGPEESLPGRDEVHVCLQVAATSAPDPAVTAAITALLADGVPTRTVAKALATLTGWDRRRCYEAVLSWPPGPDAS